jgi:hypothetical protein
VRLRGQGAQGPERSRVAGCCAQVLAAQRDLEEEEHDSDRAHAYALLDSYVYGFALSEASLPISGPETVAEVAEAMSVHVTPEEHPYLVEFGAEHILKPGYDFGEEFEFGLDMILDALSGLPRDRRPHR